MSIGLGLGFGLGRGCAVLFPGAGGAEICYNVSMVKIEIEISRPWLVLGLCSAFVLGGTWAVTVRGLAVGGLGMRAQVTVKQAEEEARQIRIRQEVLKHHEEILRYELELLTRKHAEADPGGPAEQQLWEARQKLIHLLQEKHEAEQRLLETLRQMWEAQGGAALASRGASGTVPMIWPAPPDEGLSATFGDLSYRKRFHMEHLAIDIPIPQESTVVAAADGIVLSALDQGMGYNALTIKHRSGIVTQYGHVLRFLVEEGQQVRAGDPIALSGGLPGTPGAGWLTTGPHVHFAVFIDGQPVDPLRFLPAVADVRRET